MYVSCATVVQRLFQTIPCSTLNTGLNLLRMDINQRYNHKLREQWVILLCVCVTEKCTGVTKTGNILLETDMTHHAEQYRVLSWAMTLPLCLIKQILLLMNAPCLTIILVFFKKIN